MIIAIYNGEKYKTLVEGKNVTLVTHDSKKITEGFVEKQNCFIKEVSFDDPKLEDLYDIHFFVKYQGEIWNVDGGLPTGGLHASLEDYEVVIVALEDARDDTWTQCDKQVSAKIISLLDCSDCIIEKTYLKKDGICLDKKTTETTQVDAQTLRDQMLSMKNI